MALWLYKLGRFSARRAWLVIAAWAVIMGMVGGAAALFMGPMSNNFQIPGTETQQMADKLQAELPEASGGTGIGGVHHQQRRNVHPRPGKGHHGRTENGDNGAHRQGRH